MEKKMKLTECAATEIARGKTPSGLDAVVYLADMATSVTSAPDAPGGKIYNNPEQAIRVTAGDKTAYYPLADKGKILGMLR
jgi:hypothetical protein